MLIFLAHFSFFFPFFLNVHFFSSLFFPLLPPIYPYCPLSYRPMDLRPLKHCNLACDVWSCACFKDARLQNVKAVFTRTHLFSIKRKFVVDLLNISATALRCFWPVACLLKCIRQQMLLTKIVLNFSDWLAISLARECKNGNRRVVDLVRAFSLWTHNVCILTHETYN